MPYASWPFYGGGSTEGRPSYPIVPRVETFFVLWVVGLMIGD